MRRPIPPLNALRAFEAAARHLSLTKAAAELNVTPGALSHQIRALEVSLGLALFERRVRSIALTPAGRRLYPGLNSGFAQLREAVEALDDAKGDDVLVVSTPFGFAAKWLVPRLHLFSHAHPEVEVRVSSTMALATFRGDGVDVAIRTMAETAAPEPHLHVEKLVGFRFVPVCSPAFLAGHGPFETARSLLDVPLVHDDSRHGMPGWPEWFAAAGLPDADVSRGHRFSSADHALAVTVDGAGVFLAHDVLAQDDLRMGRLVVAHPLTLDSDRAYYFVCLKSRRDRPAIAAFRDWIVAETAAARSPQG
jgi:LysR family glycine cleavage system transcriptional activator